MFTEGDGSVGLFLEELGELLQLLFRQNLPFVKYSDLSCHDGDLHKNTSLRTRARRMDSPCEKQAEVPRTVPAASSVFSITYFYMFVNSKCEKNICEYEFCLM